MNQKKIAIVAQTIELPCIDQMIVFTNYLEDGDTKLD